MFYFFLPKHRSLLGGKREVASRERDECYGRSRRENIRRGGHRRTRPNPRRLSMYPSPGCAALCLACLRAVGAPRACASGGCPAPRARLRFDVLRLGVQLALGPFVHEPARRAHAPLRGARRLQAAQRPLLLQPGQGQVAQRPARARYSAVTGRSCEPTCRGCMPRRMINRSFSSQLHYCLTAHALGVDAEQSKGRF
jgi:hypothetical protein